MVELVIAVNVMISLLCLFVAWRLWRLRRSLARFADRMIVYERNTHRVLHQAPRSIGQRQAGVSQLRRYYRLLEVQVQQLQQVISLLGLGQLLLRQRGLVMKPLLKSRSQRERPRPRPRPR
jgi:hypothetical protein